MFDLRTIYLKALKALRDRKSVWDGLDGAQKRIVESSIRQMEASGVGNKSNVFMQMIFNENFCLSIIRLE